MACIQATTQIKGEAKTDALLGAKYMATAHCLGRAAAANSRLPKEPPVPQPGLKKA